MNNLTNNEKDAIKPWTSAEQREYRIIKDILKGEYSGTLKSYYEQKAQLLLGLFEKYEDNTEDKILYRGDVLEDKTHSYTNKEIYMNYLSNNPIGKCVVIRR